MNYTTASQLAQQILLALAPYCKRIAIAGSIRRLKQTDIKDIEILAIPDHRYTPNVLGEVVHMTQLTKANILSALPPGTTLKKNGDKFKQISLPDATIIDLFIVTYPAQWGNLLAIRTGPSDYSRWLVTSRQGGGARPSHLTHTNGALYDPNINLIPCPEEEDFFNVLEIPYPEPHQRTPHGRKLPII